jgi:hypothetical protein
MSDSKRRSLWLSPWPWEPDRGYLWNFLTFWRFRGVTWRYPRTGRIGYVFRAAGRWRTKA